MRSKIEANEYKDYILGFMFYKFLSEREEKTLHEKNWSNEDIKESLTGDNTLAIKSCQDWLGYYIEYKYLFSTWRKMGADFGVHIVRDALSAFNRLISTDPKKNKLFKGIFGTLDAGLSKLGENTGAQTKAINRLIDLIAPIPMDDKSGYDILGYIYEDLISKFASNAGKKAGEFYTPHEVSLVMSNIAAEHLKGKEAIKVYDPTSGSGSLLINIGRSAAKYLGNKDKIKYYAQELKDSTYSLTRMNLVMRGIIPDNITVHCGDSLLHDWPYYEDGDIEGTYNYLAVDAVVSNPPYSQVWEPKDDKRFAGYGLAPRSKADYAFLLHCLYHINSGGICTIVLPHGVLFRGGEEANIRRALVENNNIDAIIGLPPNIFFGTGIPTIIMVLKKQREEHNILIIDASKGFKKQGKNNVLRACDIKKICDTVQERKSIAHYSSIVPTSRVRENEYNLNIPRYVCGEDSAESFDLGAAMLGGAGGKEVDAFAAEWEAFPSLKDALFTQGENGIYRFCTGDAKGAIEGNKDVIAFLNDYDSAFSDLGERLEALLIKDCQKLDARAAAVSECPAVVSECPAVGGVYRTVGGVYRTEEGVAEDIFRRMSAFPLLDKYEAYQMLDDAWQVIERDTEAIQESGGRGGRKGIMRAALVIPRMGLRRAKDGGTYEVQEGWEGELIPFELIQRCRLKAELEEIERTERALEEEAAAQEVEDEQGAESAEGAGDAQDAENAQDTASAPRRNSAKEKELRRKLTALKADIEAKSKKEIESLDEEGCREMLRQKWIVPLLSGLAAMPRTLLSSFTERIAALERKYSTTLLTLDAEIKDTEKELAAMLGQLTAGDSDIAGLKALAELLDGNNA